MQKVGGHGKSASRHRHVIDGHDVGESRIRTDVPDQQLWVSLVHLLADGTSPGTARPDAALIRAVLREFARDDFALLRQNPPLLYHNDLTATVARYYWSEDVGYALWLRLHDVYAHITATKS